jgi:erythromycin esterase-like protein
MKKWFLAFFILIIGNCYSQSIEDSCSVSNSIFRINSVDPSDTLYNDLEFLDKVLQGVEVLLLGEQAHGEGNVTLAKTRLINFLVTKLGFNIIAFELPYFKE